MLQCSTDRKVNIQEQNNRNAPLLRGLLLALIELPRTQADAMKILYTALKASLNQHKLYVNNVWIKGALETSNENDFAFALKTIVEQR
jgi:hypothetical protein